MYKIDRVKFINWVSADLIKACSSDMREDLKKSGEFILEATHILRMCEEIPVHLLENYIEDEAFVAGSDCELIYKNPFI